MNFCIISFYSWPGICKCMVKLDLPAVHTYEGKTGIGIINNSQNNVPMVFMLTIEVIRDHLPHDNLCEAWL